MITLFDKSKYKHCLRLFNVQVLAFTFIVNLVSSVQEIQPLNDLLKPVLRCLLIILIAIVTTLEHQVIQVEVQDGLGPELPS